MAVEATLDALAAPCTCLHTMGDRHPRSPPGDASHVDHQMCARMAILMGIHTALRSIFVEPAGVYAWIRRTNETFGGRSAPDVMTSDETPDLILMHRYANSVRCG